MKPSHPTIVILNGANWIGAKLVELMLEQKANVIVVDDFVDKNIPFIKRFSDSKRFIFIEKDKINTLRENFTKIKYFIHLRHDFNTSNDKLSSKQFIGETKFVDDVLSLVLDKNSTYLLTSSIHLHKDYLLKKSYMSSEGGDAYTEADLQGYVEKTVLEYSKKASLDARIVRLGNMYGPEMDLEKDILLKQILTDALYRDSIRIYGDGLDYMYYVYINDAIQGVFKALFSKASSGKTYSLTNPEEISVLTIVNKVISLGATAQKIKFVKQKHSLDPLYAKAYIPDDNLSEIGWKPKVSFDRGLAQVFDYFRKDVSLRDYAEVTEQQNNIEMYTPESSDDLDIGFDDTVNLSTTLSQGTHDIETAQFNDFYKKLNNENSPIYNRNKKLANAKLKKEKTKIQTAFTVIFVFLLLSLTVFVIVPIVRAGIFYKKVEAASKVINSSIASKNFSTVKTSELSNESENIMSSIDWMLVRINKTSLEQRTQSTALGIDYVTKIVDKLGRENLTQYTQPGGKITQEADVAKVQDVKVLLNQASTHLNEANSGGLPFGIKQEIVKIQAWVAETDKNLSDALNK